MRVVLIGGTGLVGTRLADRLLGDESAEVHALLRRPSGRSHPRWHEHVAPPSDWPEIVADLGAAAALATLGTTLRKAGSKAAFRAVDLDMARDFATSARAAGADRFLLLSSVGANRQSRNFYLRTKGEIETAVAGLSFERLDIFQPGLLRGKREGDPRVAERIGIVLSPALNLFLKGPLDRFAAVDADLVAAAMAATLHDRQPGVHRHDNSAIRRLARLYMEKSLIHAIGRSA